MSRKKTNRKARTKVCIKCKTVYKLKTHKCPKCGRPHHGRKKLKGAAFDEKIWAKKRIKAGVLI